MKVEKQKVEVAEVVIDLVQDGKLIIGEPIDSSVVISFKFNDKDVQDWNPDNYELIYKKQVPETIKDFMKLNSLTEADVLEHLVEHINEIK